MMVNDQWKTEYHSKNNGVWPPFFDDDEDVTGKRNFNGKGVSKNKTSCENAVARK